MMGVYSMTRLCKQNPMGVTSKTPSHGWSSYWASSVLTAWDFNLAGSVVVSKRTH